MGAVAVRGRRVRAPRPAPGRIRARGGEEEPLSVARFRAENAEGGLVRVGGENAGRRRGVDEVAIVRPDTLGPRDRIRPPGTPGAARRVHRYVTGVSRSRAGRRRSPVGAVAFECPVWGGLGTIIRGDHENIDGCDDCGRGGTAHGRGGTTRRLHTDTRRAPVGMAGRGRLHGVGVPDRRAPAAPGQAQAPCSASHRAATDVSLDASRHPGATPARPRLRPQHAPAPRHTTAAAPCTPLVTRPITPRKPRVIVRRRPAAPGRPGSVSFGAGRSRSWCHTCAAASTGADRGEPRSAPVGPERPRKSP